MKHPPSVGMKRIVRNILRQTKQWIEEPTALPDRPLAFNNSYEWIGQAFHLIEKDPGTNGYQAYIWGVLQGAALAKVLGCPRISVLEFGVAGGRGLVSLERIAELVEHHTEVGIDVYGFDTGKGLPKPQDYRDVPYMWEEGDFTMDQSALRARLKRAQLRLGLVEETVPEFLRTSFAPLGFISFDVDLYSATKAKSLDAGCTAPQSLTTHPMLF